MTERDAYLCTGLLCTAALLLGPPRTRPLAGAVYGWTLSRAQGLSRARIETTIGRLFDERASAHRRIDGLEELLATREHRLAMLESIISGIYGERDLETIDRGIRLPSHNPDALVVFHAGADRR